MNKLSLGDGYRAAAQFLMTRVAVRLANMRPSGYWLDDRHFVFPAQRYDTATDSIQDTPTIADTVTGNLATAFTFETAAKALSAQLGKPVDAGSLSLSRWEVSGIGDFSIEFEGSAYRIALPSGQVASLGHIPVMQELYSPDGRIACFIKEHDLWLRDRQTDVSRPLTIDGAAHNAYGRSPESDTGAITGRSKPRPLGLWSPDSQWLVTHRIDERAVRDQALIQSVPAGQLHPVLHTFKAPLRGDEAMPTAKLVAIHIETRRMVVVDDPQLLVYAFSPFLLSQVWWSRNSGEVYFLAFGRYFRSVSLHVLSLRSGATRRLLSETSETYIDLNPVMGSAPNVRVLAKTDEVVWFSERDGWGHLYLHDASTGALKNRITQGEWVVRDIVHLDETARRIVFIAGGIDPAIDPYYRQLYAVDLDGTNLRTISAGNADHFVSPERLAGTQSDPFYPAYAATGASPDGRAFVVTRSRIDETPTSSILDAQGTVLCRLPDGDIAYLKQNGWKQPQPFKAKAADGNTDLYGTLFFPSNFDEQKAYPLIDYIYPGPQINWAPKEFDPAFGLCGTPQSLAELGFIVMMMDGRGMALRSREFHLASYAKLQTAGFLDDHAAVLEQLAQRHSYLDRGRIGILGQSAGGYAAARAMFDRGDIFKVGVAVCGNHDARNYNSVWLDKYHGPPDPAHDLGQANATVAHKLTGKLLLVTGDMDDNVLISQTLALADALAKANKDFDLVVIPNAGHDVLSMSGYAIRRVWDYFVQHLAKRTPPREFPLATEPSDLQKIGVLFRWMTG